MPRLAYRRGPAGHAETARRPANTTTGPRIRISPKPPNTQDGNMSNKAGSGRYQNGAARRKCKARHIAAEGPIPICPLCGKPIDLTLKTPHPLSCELDEITQNLQSKKKQQNNRQHHRPPKHKKTTTKHHPNQPPMVTGGHTLPLPCKAPHRTQRPHPPATRVEYRTFGRWGVCERPWKPFRHGFDVFAPLFSEAVTFDFTQF